MLLNMGYTRYWRIHKTLDPDKFKEYSEACKEFCFKLKDEYIKYYLSNGDNLDLATHKSDIAGPNGLGDPIFSETEISFNGRFDEKFDDLSYEGFGIRDIHTGYHFCKTARMPYDKHVLLCLYLAEAFFGDSIEISSDGDNNDIEVLSFLQRVIRDKYIEYFLE